MLLVLLLDGYTLIVFGAVIISWIQLPPTHPVASILHTMTEPLLAPLRQLLPAMGGIDFSPFVLLIAIRMVRGFVLSAVGGF